ncbi:MAG: hypothetical protein E7283_01165 [Lachnospiraceae bacterium]|nr:hypothetical protein [Lachnospiraceae bacterium]
MKNKGVEVFILTLTIVTIGSVLLLMFIVQINAMVQKNLGEGVIISTDVASNIINIEDSTTIEKNDERIVLFKTLTMTESKPINSTDYIATKIDFLYQGQKVSISDALLTKAESLYNATLIMDYVFNYVDDRILKLYEIDKTNFSYVIQRGYQLGDIIYYSVLLMEDQIIKCSIGIYLEDEPVLKSFSRDGYVNLYNQSNIPEEFGIENWCKSREEREKVYKEYFQNSKEIIEEILLMPKVLENVYNVDCVSYFSVSSNWSFVTLGYILEDGTYIKMIYNRVNQMWDGFVIEGYHLDYVKS